MHRLMIFHSHFERNIISKVQKQFHNLLLQSNPICVNIQQPAVFSISYLYRIFQQYCPYRNKETVLVMLGAISDKPWGILMVGSICYNLITKLQLLRFNFVIKQLYFYYNANFFRHNLRNIFQKFFYLQIVIKQLITIYQFFWVSFSLYILLYGKSMLQITTMFSTFIFEQIYGAQCRDSHSNISSYVQRTAKFSLFFTVMDNFFS
eukprot:TRINITY_DN25126_c1_g1_i1.p1 TRINITY_DN25126_c1_g1~~TRINITY_DN25126_c1_g1_i1.p1  ORF type:complete len:206 (-),score=-21.00 TRINITY_DN25126_c1_g1_i1:196-813(-)